MLNKLFCILIIYFLFSPSMIIRAESKASNVKVAFIRDGYLWTRIDDTEVKLIEQKATYPNPPQWSHDGKMFLYQKEVPAPDAKKGKI